MHARIVSLALWRAHRASIYDDPIVQQAAAALERAQALLATVPSSEPPPAAESSTQPVTGVRAKILPFRRPSPLPPAPADDSSEALIDTDSEWDPAPEGTRIYTPPPPALERDEGLVAQDIHGCKMLLLEIIRRAAYDWVLYRTSRRMVRKALAEQAYRWIFLEVPGSPDARERTVEGKEVTSFESICEALDLDPGRVRGYIKRLTSKNVSNIGRPAEYRRRQALPVPSSDNDDSYALPSGFSMGDDGEEVGY